MLKYLPLKTALQLHGPRGHEGSVRWYDCEPTICQMGNSQANSFIYILFTLVVSFRIFTRLLFRSRKSLRKHEVAHVLLSPVTNVRSNGTDGIKIQGSPTMVSCADKEFLGITYS